MKHNIILLVLLLPVCSFAQTVSDSLARIKLNELMDTWTLGIDSTSEAVDIRVYNRFKSLFDRNATVEDGLDVMFQYKDEKSGRYTTSHQQKAFDVYAHDVALKVKGMRLDSISELEAKTADQKNIIFRVARQIGFQKTRKYVIPDDYVSQVIRSRRRIKFDAKGDSAQAAADLEAKLTRTGDAVYKFLLKDTLRIVMAYDMDTVTIRSIHIESAEVTSLNDADFDAVLNAEDSLVNVFGDFTANGRPDYDLDGLQNDLDKCPTTYSLTNQGCPRSYFINKNEFTVFLGVQMHKQNIALPELNQLGYVDPAGNDAMDVLQSKKGALKNPGQVLGVFAGGNLTHYFGQGRKRSGVSVGFTYSKFAAEFSLTDSVVYTYKASDGTSDYRRQITIGSLTEEMDFTVINVPVMYNYRFYLNKKNKTVMNLRAGPSFMMINNKARYDAEIDFGGLYQIDTIRKDRLTYYDFFDPGSKYNLLFTTASINERNPGAADSVFSQLAAKNFDFASYKSFSGVQDISRSSIAFNLNVDLQHRISEGLTIKFGATYLYAPSLKGKEKYKPVDKTTDELQSIYNGNTKPSYSAMGLAAGLVFNF